MKHNAFTLAEVLITLGIIGIVAAMTMPSLIAKYQKQKTVSSLKKAYTVLSQAVQLSKLDNGEEKWDTDATNYGEVLSALNKYILPYIKTSKICKFSDENCFASDIKGLNGREIGETRDTDVYVTINDGMRIKFTPSGNGGMNAKVDINGVKPPNIMGRDVFEFRMDNSVVIPSCPDVETNINTTDLSKCSREFSRQQGNYGCNKKASGAYCTHVIMSDGWEIKDDYPW